jgi:hypothetical protein
MKVATIYSHDFPDRPKQRDVVYTILYGAELFGVHTILNCSRSAHRML